MLLTTDTSKAPLTTARFGLRGPRDLLDKLAADMDRLGRARKGRMSTQALANAAIDCAIGGWSLAEWTVENVSTDGLSRLIQTDVTCQNARASLYRWLYVKIPSLEICRQLANGAKHFNVSRQPLPRVSAYVGALSSQTEIGKAAGLPAGTFQYRAFIDTNERSILADDFFADLYRDWKIALGELGLL